MASPSMRAANTILFLAASRAVDPPFTIDMIIDPNNPDVLGFLKMPRLSKYLHPSSEDKLLGIGIEVINLLLRCKKILQPRAKIFKMYIDEGIAIAKHYESIHVVALDIEHERICIPAEIYSKE